MKSGPRANLEVPIHEKLLWKQNSKRNIRERNANREDYPPLRQDCPREDREQERDATTRTNAWDSRDREMESLRRKIKNMEAERTENEKATNNHEPENDASTKNGNGAQAGPSKDNRSPEEMQSYIREALQVICGFAERLNIQQDPVRIHLDK